MPMSSKLPQDWPFSVVTLRAVDPICLCFSVFSMLHLTGTGKSNLVFLWFIWWVNCMWVSELSAFVLSMSRCFPRVALNPQPNLSGCLWCSPATSFLWCVWDVERRTRGSNRGGRGIQKQLSATGLYLQFFASFQEACERGILRIWQKPQPKGTELFSDKQL